MKTGEDMPRQRDTKVTSTESSSLIKKPRETRVSLIKTKDVWTHKKGVSLKNFSKLEVTVDSGFPKKFILQIRSEVEVLAVAVEVLTVAVDLR
jgi:hypothetical protein